MRIKIIKVVPSNEIGIMTPIKLGQLLNLDDDFAKELIEKGVGELYVETY